MRNATFETGLSKFFEILKITFVTAELADDKPFGGLVTIIEHHPKLVGIIVNNISYY